MAQEHTEQQMVEWAPDNKLESDDEPKLQKVKRKRATKKCRARIELPDLNTALIEVYRELEKAIRVAKDMAVSSKQVCKQAKTATDLWQASEHCMSELEACPTQVGPNGEGVILNGEFERQRDQHLKESVDGADRLLRRFNQLMQEKEARLAAVTTSWDIVKAKLQREAAEAKGELATLQAKI